MKLNHLPCAKKKNTPKFSGILFSRTSLETEKRSRSSGNRTHPWHIILITVLVSGRLCLGLLLTNRSKIAILTSKASTMVTNRVPQCVSICKQFERAAKTTKYNQHVCKLQYKRSCGRRLKIMAINWAKKANAQKWKCGCRNETSACWGTWAWRRAPSQCYSNVNMVV